jgi:hypothetical protein
MILSRDLWPRSSTIWRSAIFNSLDRKLRSAAFAFPSTAERAELDLYRRSMFARDAVDLRIWHNMKPKSSH